MRWEDERYVRAYTRDTLEWLALGWEAHALFWELLRKADRAGILQLGKAGHVGIAVATGIPIDVVERSLPALLRDGCVTENGTTIVIKNYIDAQEAKASDKQRQREHRAKARDLALSQIVTGQAITVTQCDEKSRTVTGCHGDSVSVTPSRTEPSHLSLGSSLPLPASDQSKPDAKSSHDWYEFFKARWWEVKGRQYGQGTADAKGAGRLHEVLESLPLAERAADWEARERMVSEFLASGDPRTTRAGWSFSFFASEFNGLRIPPEKRPKPAFPGQPKQAVYR